MILGLPQLLLVTITLLIALKFALEYYSKDNRELPALSIANAQNIGTRKRQEDSFATIKDEDQVLAVVADGMGGFHSGKEASELVTKNFMEQFCRTYDINSVSQFLVNTVEDSNQKLQQRMEIEKIGTTLIAVLLKKDLLYWIAVGDSHLYLYRNQQLKQLNTDHIFAKKLQNSYQAGEISRYKMLNHPQRERLTSYLGQENLAEIDYSIDPIELQRGDRLVLCTDGVYDSISELELSQLLKQQKEDQIVAEEIIAKVMSKGQPKQDNATVVVLAKN
ncbi:PP2C family protein-serine/threonine phosphatase [Halanaerobacter jeridensis]|uniref:Serine/threonine protein phosphatase PrpC n=1 Tax=Halanaerobacter jeridensis TaxID=706427 RepID=A0A939BNK0_9FIRM|nr:protein phosphatase 2C domain-containing protein [Halanaerobacter jeridensis]MBM7555622.1 serine/threonine protein phosphatase PrpC [Halanaerobacter jeridensis]